MAILERWLLDKIWPEICVMSYEFGESFFFFFFLIEVKMQILPSILPAGAITEETAVNIN